ncbi:hypothetical protein [Devosia soli]|uniref:hypothetical protein n=1 Tax=Devosia soli TaxID=361041 RepID=UPI00128E12D0|nr:hypothetical protein [Devosia soli]
MVTQNTSDQRFACTATCQYTLTNQRPLHTFECNFALAANARQEAACDLDGTGPDHFGEVHPTKFVCQPR